jgi:hypothetical protein
MKQVPLESQIQYVFTIRPPVSLGTLKWFELGMVTLNETVFNVT